MKKDSDVAGANGSGPGQSPVQTAPPKPSDVAGASGGGAPAKTPEQSTTQAGGAPSGVAGASGGATAVQQTTAPVAGGGGAMDMSALRQALDGVIQALSALITKLGSSSVAGASGGGPAQAPPKTPEQSTTQVGGAMGCEADKVAQGGGATATPAPATPTPGTDVAGATGGGAPAKTPDQTGVAGASGGGTPAQNPVQSAVAGAKGDPTQVAGAKGDPTQAPPKKAKKKPKKTDVGGANGPGQTPGQVPPPKAKKKKPRVGGANGPGQSPTQVGGANGPGQRPAPAKKPPKPVAPPAVGGANGGPVVQQRPVVQRPPVPVTPPVQTPPVVPAVPVPVTPPPTQVGGVQGPGQKPTQVGGVQGPRQVPTQVPTQVGGAKGGTVILNEQDLRASAKLTSPEGNSVEVWGDPHIAITIDGKSETWDIGYGPGSIQLSDGSTVSWDTYEPGSPRQFQLHNFRIDSAGTANDRAVSTSDGTDSANLTTALNDAQLREFATALRMYEGPMDQPLRPRSTPGQVPGQTPAA